ERRRRRFNQAILASGMKLGGGLGPSGSRSVDCGNHDTPRFGAKLDVPLKPCLLEQQLGDANALGVADGNDAGLHGGSCEWRLRRYNVITAAECDTNRVRCPGREVTCPRIR